jgi:2,3-diketo-5-methylthio-1-phosphopentane phosphatase
VTSLVCPATQRQSEQLGLDPGLVPLHGTYRVEDGISNGDASSEPQSKRMKVGNSKDGWNAAGQVDNARDLAANPVPILPRDGKHLLLDIEGCTTAISFVKDTLFPYVLEHLDEYLNALQPTEYNALAHELSDDLTPEQKSNEEVDISDCASMIRFMVKNDLKLASLKSLQGTMWKSGYERGDLKGHVYSDVVHMLQWMQSHGVKVYIYSSGSVQAQKLLFGYSSHGDLCEFFERHFDITTSGNKKESSSYTSICDALDIPPSDLLFCSDAEAELEAAREAGVGKVIMTVRPGNAPLTAQGRKDYPQIFSLLQLCGV